MAARTAMGRLLELSKLPLSLLGAQDMPCLCQTDQRRKSHPVSQPLCRFRPDGDAQTHVG